MLANFYQKNIIEKPKLIFSLLIIILMLAFYFAKDFRLDASSDTLLLENDPDLKYLNEINNRYGAKEFLGGAGGGPTNGYNASVWRGVADRTKYKV